MSWQALEEGHAELADFGSKRFATGVAYLVTVRKERKEGVAVHIGNIRVGRVVLSRIEGLAIGDCRMKFQQGLQLIPKSRL